MLKRLLWLPFAGAAAIATAEPLTYSAALEIAARTSPQVAAETANVDATREAATAAGRLPDPKLAVGIENLPVTGPDQWSLTRDFMTMRKVGIMQEIPNRARRGAESAAAQAAIVKAETERQVSLLAVRRNTAVAWLERYYLERRATLFDELERENQLFAAAVKAQLASGGATAADSIEPQQEAADIADQRDELAGELARSKAALKRWVGNAAEEPLVGEPPVLELDSNVLRAHVHEHPDLAVFAPMTQMAQAEVHAAEAAKRPDWGVEVAYARRGDTYSDMISLQFTLSLPLFPKNRQDPQIRAKRQELTRVEAERDAMFRDHTEELEADLAEYETMTRQLARLRETRSTLAQQKADYAFAGYRSGTTNLATVLTTRRELIDVRLKQIELEGKRAVAAAKLYYFTQESSQ